MSSGEKILSTIRKDSEEAITEIQVESKEKCAKIIAKGQKKALEIRENAEKTKAEQSLKLQKAYQSRIELEKRNAILKTKRNEIEKAVAYVLAAMDRLEDEAYFELLYHLAGTLGQRKGIVYLNERDLKRVPADFEQRLAGKGVRATLSKTPDSSLKNGFLLKNGDIEDNMSFGSVMAEKREAVEDLINRELFKR